MTTKQTVYIDIIEAEKKGYFNMTAEEIFKNHGQRLLVDNPHYEKEIAYTIDGDSYSDCGCCELDIDDAKFHHWNNCPFCGEEISESIFEVYKTRSNAEKNKYAEEFGISEVLMITVVKGQGDGPQEI